MENQLAKIVEESGLEKSKAQILLENFSNYFEIAAEWETKMKAIQVTDVTQVTEMRMAREARLFLKQKRVDIEKTRKVLKESALREGQTIDSIAKILTNLIIPIEDDAERKEKFAEIKEAEMKAARKLEREAKIQPYSEFIPLGMDFLNMLDQDFEMILSGAKSQHEAKIETERKAEADRIAREKAEAAERERIRLENERLKKEAEEREAEMAKERAKAEAERKEIERKAAEERKVYEAKLKEEREERERAEAELKHKAAEEEARNQEAAKAEAEKIAAEKKAARAPDKVKLAALKSLIENIELPETKSEEAGKIVADTRVLLQKVCTFIEEKTKNL